MVSYIVEDYTEDRLVACMDSIEDAQDWIRSHHIKQHCYKIHTQFHYCLWDCQLDAKEGGDG